MPTAVCLEERESLEGVDGLSFGGINLIFPCFLNNACSTTQHGLSLCVTITVFVEVSLDQNGVNEHDDLSERCCSLGAYGFYKFGSDVSRLNVSP